MFSESRLFELLNNILAESKENSAIKEPRVQYITWLGSIASSRASSPLPCLSTTMPSLNIALILANVKSIILI